MAKVFVNGVRVREGRVLKEYLDMPTVTKMLKKVPVKSVRDVEETLAWFRDLAEAGDQRVAFDDALYHVRTGRLSGSTCYAIAANFKEVCRWLLKHAGVSTEDVGKYLHTYDSRIEEGTSGSFEESKLSDYYRV